MYTFEDYIAIIDKLRAPGGCPWDAAQTHDSLKEDMVDETCEALAAIDVYYRTGDASNLCEELGDVLLLVMMQSRIAEEEGLFSIRDVVNQACEKMIRRHPHVFGDGTEVPDWKTIKEEEKKMIPPHVEKAKKEALEEVKKAAIAQLLR